MGLQKLGKVSPGGNLLTVFQIHGKIVPRHVTAAFLGHIGLRQGCHSMELRLDLRDNKDTVFPQSHIITGHQLVEHTVFAHLDLCSIADAVAEAAGCIGSE